MIAWGMLQADTCYIACTMCLLFSICALLVCLQFGHINSLPFTSDSLIILLMVIMVQKSIFQVF